MHFAEAYAYLLGLPRWEQKGPDAYHPGLSVIDELLTGMGRPQEAYPSVLVAGTNGKGSTASFIAAACTAAGLPAGLHTSPHLIDFSERMRVDGVPAPREWIAAAVTEYRALLDSVRPTFFEAAVALSLKYFADAQVKIAVVEVGLGGRLDATNILDAECSVITRIGYDHMEILGPTLEAIAREKSGIIKPGRPIVMAAQDRAAAATIRRCADEVSGLLINAEREVEVEVISTEAGGTALIARTPVRTYRRLTVGLPGAHQLENASAALRAVEVLSSRRSITQEAIETGFADVRKLSGLQGRCEIVQRSPLIIVDVAHNPEGIKAALSCARSVVREGGRIRVLVGLMRDKDAHGVARVLSDDVSEVMVLGGFAERALASSELHAICEAAGATAFPVHSVEQVLERLKNADTRDVLLATGSHVIVSMVKTSLQQAGVNTISS